MDLPSNLYHDSNCMGLVLYASFSIHGDPNFILSHLNLGKSHSLDCQCQMSMANVDDQTIAFCTSKEEVTWLLELGEFIWISYVPGEPFKNMLQHFSRIEASFVSDLPGVISLEVLILSGCRGQAPKASYFLGLIPTLSSIGTTLTLPYTDRLRKKKKKKTQARDQQRQQVEDDKNHNKWKSETQQHIYTSKLVRALGQVHLSPPLPSATATATRRGQAMLEAADRVLAVAAKGKSGWSRAILANLVKLKSQKKHRKWRRVVSATGTSRSPKKPKESFLRVSVRGKSSPDLQRKARVLGRLVPGCRKQTLPVILGEATDYIDALQMQVRAMTTLANLASSSSAPPPS